MNRTKHRSYERRTDYMKAIEWNALGVEARSTGTIETYKQIIKKELNALLD